MNYYRAYFTCIKNRPGLNQHVVQVPHGPHVNQVDEQIENLLDASCYMSLAIRPCHNLKNNTGNKNVNSCKGVDHDLINYVVNPFFL